MIPIQHQPHQPSLDGGFPGLGPLLHMDAALSDELLSSATAVSVSSLENIGMFLRTNRDQNNHMMQPCHYSHLIEIGWAP